MKKLLLIICFVIQVCYGQSVKTIHLEIKKGYIFTTILVDGVKAKAMIDFGDPNLLQLSTTFIEKNKINTHKPGSKSYDAFGNEFELDSGKLVKLVVSDIIINHPSFLSGKYEIELVQKEIGVKFDATLGWEFFKHHIIKVDYKKKEITLMDSLPSLTNHFQKAAFKKSNYISFDVQLDTTKATLILDSGSPFNLVDSSWYSQQASFISSEIVSKKHKAIFSLEFNRIQTNFTKGDKTLIDYYPYHLPELITHGFHGILGKPFFNEHLIYLDNKQKIMLFKKNS